MDAIHKEWRYRITALALLSVVTLFGVAYGFIRSTTESDKRLRWLRTVDRRERQSRGEEKLHRT